MRSVWAATWAISTLVADEAIGAHVVVLGVPDPVVSRAPRPAGRVATLPSRASRGGRAATHDGEVEHGQQGRVVGGHAAVHATGARARGGCRGGHRPAVLQGRTRQRAVAAGGPAVVEWVIDDLTSLRGRIEQLAGSTEGLRALFHDLEARLGRKRASELWWAVFAAQDATHT